MNLNKVTPESPTLKDLLDLAKRDIFLSFNCHALATVQSFDSVKQTVTATINYKKMYFKSSSEEPVLVDYPILIDCPIYVLSDGDLCNLTFPIKQGATCSILFNDRDIDNWFHSGQINALSTSRMHSLADGIALVGIRAMNNTIDDYDAYRPAFTDGNYKVTFGQAGGTGPVLARLTDMNETRGLEVGAAYARLFKGTTIVEAQASKVKIANSLYTLNALLQELIQDVQDLVTATAGIVTTPCVVGNPVQLNPASQSAVFQAGTELAATATKIAGLLV